MANEIKPCPFCEGKARIMYREAEFLGWRGGDGCKGKRFFAYVGCNRCHARGPIVKTDVVVDKEQYNRGFDRIVEPYAAKAIQLWNVGANDCRKWRSLTKAAGTTLGRRMESVSAEVEAANDGE